MSVSTLNRFAALCCSVAVLTASAVVAQPVPKSSQAKAAKSTRTQKPSTPAPTVDLDPKVTAQVVKVTLNKAKVIRLDHVSSDVEIIIARPEVADVHVKDNQQIFILGQAVGTTTIFVLEKSGTILLQGEIQVSIDASEVQDAIRTLMPKDKISVSARRDNIFLTGVVRSPQTASNAVSIARRFVPDAINVVNMLQVTSKQQVILQVRVAEIARSIQKDLGMDTTLDFTSTDSLGFSLLSAGAAKVAAPFASGAITTGIGALTGVTYNALEAQGLIKILAEPTLTAISGETANFLAGGEYITPTGVNDAGNPTWEFKEYGIRLAFTPIVMSEGRINLQIATEVSTLGDPTPISAGVNVQGLLVRRAATTVDLPSGGSLMIAGLIENSETDNVSGVPFLKDLPVLGALFRSVEFQRNETELAILVTAYLAKPVDNSAKLSAPTDGFETSSDMDIYLLGRLHREYANSELPPWATTLKGPYGYIME